MNYSEEDIEEIFKIIEEDRENRLLQEQLLNLSLNPDDQKKEKVVELSKPQVTQNPKIQIEAKEQTQNSEDQNMIRTKREKFREDLRKEEQQSKFKLKRQIVPLVMEELCQFGEQENKEKNERAVVDQDIEGEKPKKRPRRRR